MSGIEFKDIIIVIIIIIAATLAAGLSVYQYIDSVQKDKKNEQLQIDLITAQKQALEKAENLERANEEIKDKANALIKTQSELNLLQNETLKKVMGHGYAHIIASPNSLNSFKLFAESKSDYPIYDLGIMVYDQNKLNACPKIKQGGEERILLSCFYQAGHEVPVFNLGYKKLQDLAYTVNLDSDKHFIIKIISKHNIIYQYSIIKIDAKSKKFLHYYRIFEWGNNPKLLESDSYNISNKIFEDIFPYKKEIPVFYD